MHAYDFILVLFSFVYAAAITHILSTAGELIIAAKRVQLSWFNAGWMLGALLFTCAWWIGLWDLHTVTVWSVGAIAFYFFVAAGIYLNARLVSPRVPERGELNLRALRLLNPGGILMTASCSYNILEHDFLDIIRKSARDSGSDLRLIGRYTQGADHPILISFPESYYLKCFFLQKVN